MKFKKSFFFLLKYLKDFLYDINYYANFIFLQVYAWYNLHTL